MSYQNIISVILANLKEAGASSFKPKDLAEAAGCTYQTVMNYIKANPDQIYKIKHGVWGFVAQEETPTTGGVQDYVDDSENQTSSTNLVSSSYSTSAPLSAPQFERQEFDW